jgi:hypothetical protein
MLFQKSRRWFALVLLVALVGVVGVCAIPNSRHALLRGIGWALVAQDPPGPADMVIVSNDSLAAGILEAATLVDAGYTQRVGFFDRNPPSPLGLELARRGLPRVDLQAFSFDLGHALGLKQIELLPAIVGTVDEGAVLQQWCSAHNIRSILFVSMTDHSRRTRRVLARALAPQGIRVRVRWAHFSQFDPDHWWQTRNGQRIAIIESEKLLVDILKHPFTPTVAETEKS